jgi:hypothetical protein
MFAAGAAIGSAVTWKVLKTKYDRIVQEEIDAIKEGFSEVYGNREESNVNDENVTEKEEPIELGLHQIDWSEYEDLEEETYTPTEEDICEYQSLAHNYHDGKGGAYEVKKEPYVIAPLDFGEIDGYSQVELTYYLDGILEDDEYHIVTDADELIGPKALTTFGEYEDDSVFVRNDYLKADFQILKDYRTYDEAKRVGPNRVDDE